MKAVIYARVSSERQAEEGYSIEAQLDLLRKFAKANNFDIAKEYIEEETAKSSGRTKFVRMLQFLIENPNVKTILVEKTDRLYRNFDDYVELKRIKNIKVYFVKEGGTISTKSSAYEKLMHGFLVLMAENYLNNLSEEVKKGLNKKAALGFWPGNPPIGYVKDQNSKKMFPDPDRASLIRRLFEAYATGHYSLKPLTVLAYDIGLRSVNGLKVNKAGIHRILTNISYTGKFFIYKENLYDNGVHAPIVSQELFNSVQHVLNGGTTPKQTKHDFAFRGVMKCHRCGCSMTPDIKKGKYVYYRCTQFKGPCKNTVSELKLVDLFAETVKEIRITEKAADGLKAALRESHADKEEYHNQALKTLRTRYDVVRRYQEQAYIDRLDGKIDDLFWKRKSSDWNKELQDIEAQIESHRHANHEYLEMGNQIIELAKDSYDMYLDQTNHERRRLLNHLLSNCTIDNGSLCVTYRKPFDLFAKGDETEIKRG